MSSSGEAQREREVQRYLQSWQVAQGSSLNVALNVDSIAAPDLQSTGYTPRKSSDKSLTAFAQLAVLRLNVRRAMVSLIDSTTQTILAEATRHIQLGDLDANAPVNASTNDDGESDLWLGATILSRPDAVCEHSLINTCTAKDANDQSFAVPGLIVSDCRLDSRFSTRPYVLSEPGVRFYAGVPIVSRNGHRIGSFAVSDERPHDGLTMDEIRFMQGIAQTVMEHLEWARDRVDRFKGERIVRGLAAFVEDCIALNDDPAMAKDDGPHASATARPPEMPLISSKRPLSLSGTYFRGSGSPRSSLSYRLKSEANGSPPHSPPRTAKQGNKAKPDSISNVYHRAAEILRRSTLADGVVFLGATGTTSRQMNRAVRSGGSKSSDEDEQSMQVTSGSEGVGLDSSDSDTSPAARPCKILSYSITDERVRAGLEQGPSLSLGTLEKYFALYPMGKTLSFTETGAGVSSEDDSASDREPGRVGAMAGDRLSAEGRRRKVRMDHEELLKKIPGAKSVVFVPLFDYSEDRFAGGCFLWTSVTGRMMNLDQDLSYLRAFANSIMSQIGRINTQKNEAAKTTFIASMSHELRSPLHGILGSAELLRDTDTDSYQSGLVSSISTCGKTLLDTLNHVLDYSKINRIGRAQMRKSARQNRPVVLSSDSLESLSMTAVVDLAVLVEEVVDAIAAGHAFKKLDGAGALGPTMPSDQQGGPQTVGTYQAPGSDEPVSVLLDICPKTSWMVKTQPGALRRIIMNLFGNALKYTRSGFVLVSLSSQAKSDGSKVNALIRVTDTGQGMSDDFQQNRLFVPFSQEDSFQPGTGLGLSIVKQIVDSLGGTLEVKSEQHRGTEIDVHLRLAPVSGEAARQPDETMRAVAEQTNGKRLVLLEGDDAPQSPPVVRQVAKLNEVLVDNCSSWFGLKVEKETDANVREADIYMYCEPPSVESLERRFRHAPRTPRKIPIVIVCLNAEEAVRISQKHIKVLAELSQIVEVIPQPCGPRKLAKVFGNCLKRAEEVAQNHGQELTPAATPEYENGPGGSESSSDSTVAFDERVVVHHDEPPPAVQQEVASTRAIRKSLDSIEPPPGILNPPGPAEQKDTKLHVLLVDDNKINLKLLVMFMKKCGFSYEEAENGQEAVDRFIGASGVSLTEGAPPSVKRRRFDFVLMDISMPVLNGFEATKQIREFEREHQLEPPANVVALTGLASADARREAESAGIDVFLPKPVRFAELNKLLSASHAAV